MDAHVVIHTRKRDRAQIEADYGMDLVSGWFWSGPDLVLVWL